MVKIDRGIQASVIDEQRYINKEFTNKKGEMFKVLGIHSLTKNRIKKYVCEFADGYRTSATGKRINNGTVKNKKENNECESEIIKTLSKKNQRLSDDNMKLRRIIREENRFENILESAYDKIKEHIIPYIPKKTYEYKESDVDIVAHCTDWHLGEVIKEMFNVHTFEDAKKKVSLYFDKIYENLNLYKSKNLILCFTGDMVNLDSHRDKKLTNEDVRPVALGRLFNEILVPNIEALLELGINIKIASVVGNEGRIDGKEYMTSNSQLSGDNYDYLMIVLLKSKFPTIEFLTNGDELEAIIKVRNENILLMHGHTINHKNIINSIETVKVKIFSAYKKLVTFTLLGHIHELLVTHRIARSSGLVGANGFSYNQLHKLSNDPVQVILAVSDKGITVIPVELSC